MKKKQSKTNLKISSPIVMSCYYRTGTQIKENPSSIEGLEITFKHAYGGV